ncbi:MAG: MATE family efflux transporter [Oscillospiraceae bacterium]|nr:MATE family efflux transporter [Oscillospiraceae bacterium]
MAKQQKIIRDLTVGSVPKTLLSFSMPLFLSGLLQMVYNMVDMVVVGRFVGTLGLSAVAIGGEVLQLITFVAMGFSNAGQILISRYVGEEDHDRVGRMVGTLFTLLLSLAVVITIAFLFTYQGILRWLNTPADIWEFTRQYAVTCVIGTIFIYGYNLVSAILRGMGDSRHPFQFIAIASVINIVLDILFVGPLKMGPLGAALATVIGQAVSFLFALRLLYRNREQICFDFHPSHFRMHKDTTKPLISLGIPMVIQSAAVTFSMLFVNSYINAYGTVAVAVTGVARKLEGMIGVVSQAISSAGGAMVSQALGAGKTERVPKIVFTALWIVAIPASVFAVITFFKPEWLFGLFSDDPAVLAMALTYVPVALVQYLGATLRPANFALINGSGNSRLNLAVALLDGIAARIGLALLLGVALSWGIVGFWYGNAFAGCVPFFIGGTYLLSGNWKNRASLCAPQEAEEADAQ